MKRRHAWLLRWALPTMLAMASVGSAWGQLCIQYYGGRITENFNTLAASGSSNTASSIPSGWAFVEAGTGGTLTYAADNGSSTTGNTYSYGSTGSSDRAFGELTSSTVQPTLGMCLVNASGSPITRFVVGYTGEQWRLGDATAPADKLDFQYSTNATSLNSGTYVDVDELDFVAPNNTSVGALNGNSAANRTVFAPVLVTPASPIPHGQTMYMRWVPLLLAGANDGLAIDDWSFDGGTPCNLDLDLNGQVDPLTDGLMLMRAMLGIKGTAVTSGALGMGATRTGWAEMALHLNASCSTSFATGP